MLKIFFVFSLFIPQLHSSSSFLHKLSSLFPSSFSIFLIPDDVLNFNWKPCVPDFIFIVIWFSCILFITIAFLKNLHNFVFISFFFHNKRLAPWRIVDLHHSYFLLNFQSYWFFLQNSPWILGFECMNCSLNGTNCWAEGDLEIFEGHNAEINFLPEDCKLFLTYPSDLKSMPFYHWQFDTNLSFFCCNGLPWSFTTHLWRQIDMHFYNWPQDFNQLKVFRTIKVWFVTLEFDDDVLLFRNLPDW